uniref:Uncharacterized protein n=1 Tax=Arundo donax TaxID=35708 RepID=A0A0A9DBX9_ARUDO
MSAAQLLRHSRKLRSLQNAVDCDRSSLVRCFSSGSGSFLVKENGAGKRTGGNKFFQYNKHAKELETFKVPLGVNRSYTWRRAPTSSIPNAVSGLNGSFSWYLFIYCIIFSLFGCIGTHENK